MGFINTPRQGAIASCSRSECGPGDRARHGAGCSYYAVLCRRGESRRRL